LFLIFSFCTCNYANAVRMTDISALTFVRGEMTKGRRLAPISQLECAPGSARNDFTLHPHSVQCINVGNDGINVQWKCEANLDPRVKFGKIVVSCEGFSHKDDPYALVGSCGLKYGLEYETGRPESHTSSHQTYSSNSPYEKSQYEYESIFSGSILYSIVKFGIIVLIVYYIMKYLASFFSTLAYGYRNSGSSGYYNSADPSYGSGYNNGFNAYSSNNGWWSGFATGGLLSNLWNSWNRPYSSGYGRPSWFGGYGNRVYTHPDTSFGSNYGYSGSGNSGSTRSRTSTGYATSETR